MVFDVEGHRAVAGFDCWGPSGRAVTTAGQNQSQGFEKSAKEEPSGCSETATGRVEPSGRTETATGREPSDRTVTATGQEPSDRTVTATGRDEETKKRTFWLVDNQGKRN